MPLIIFAYMYQVNIPLIYYELERRNAKTMGKVLLRGSSAAIVLYAMVGIFGYVTFVHTPNVITQNIFEAPYGNNLAIIVVSIAHQLNHIKGPIRAVLRCHDSSTIMRPPSKRHC